jgi:hypothetical protein
MKSEVAAAVTSFEVLSQHSLGGTEEIHEASLPVWSAFLPLTKYQSHGDAKKIIALC